ncbi:MAG: hypothetical protein R3E36_05355 [Nitrosomonas sp.]|nr:hypothetical protein [Nitrosomonas sp.]
MLKYLKDAVIALGSRLFATLFSVFSWIIERFVQIAFFLRERLLAFLSWRFVGGVSLTSFVLIPGISHAALADDVASAVATFADVNTAIPVVGAAFLLALGILAAWKLVRGAFA